MHWNILGHAWAAHLLQKHIAHNALRHAYLFTGAPGVGKRTLALRLAQAVNCVSPPAVGQMCAVCRTCKQIERMQYADLTVVDVLPEKSDIAIDQVRAVQHSLSLSPLEAHLRVALLLNFGKASINAQNALLRTLEETSERAIILVTAEAAEDLLPTIVSRCELLRLRPMGLGAMESALQTFFHYPPAEAHSLAHISGGRVGYARRLHDQPELLRQRHDWLKELFRLLSQSRRARIAYTEKPLKNRSLTQQRQMLREAFTIWQSAWRDAYLLASAANLPLTNVEDEEQLQRLAQTTGAGGAQAHLADLEKALRLLDANANPRLVWEVVLLGFPRLADGSKESTHAS
jgi:DNA polymerase-3 subunit delta'